MNLIGLVVYWLILVLFFKKFYICNETFTLNLGTVVELTNNLTINFTLYFDKLSFSFALLTSTIATFAIMYAIIYFKYESDTGKLIMLLSLFV